MFCDLKVLVQHFFFVDNKLIIRLFDFLLVDLALFVQKIDAKGGKISIDLGVGLLSLVYKRVVAEFIL